MRTPSWSITRTLAQLITAGTGGTLCIRNSNGIHA